MSDKPAVAPDGSCTNEETVSGTLRAVTDRATGFTSSHVHGRRVANFQHDKETTRRRPSLTGTSRAAISSRRSKEPGTVRRTGADLVLASTVPPSAAHPAARGAAHLDRRHFRVGTPCNLVHAASGGR